ncbi:MAG TPA: flagellar basal body P-ring protein FlgI [Bryobacteraceae bacterium]|jgi:flagellar P-ring protein precursor FlgI|nr:flagellar basal body P-ring protein FlgI [Bryobacteraceae bacterium]
MGSIFAALLFLNLALELPAETRLKDLVSIEGVRDNQLVGYGIVVGLNKTGDKLTTVFSAQSLTNALERMGLLVNPSAIIVANTAGVMITATLPPFAQPGTKIDVTAAAVGDATNLQGGLLLMTSLHGANGQVYAVAQGPVVTGGFVAGRGGNNQTVNHPTVGRVPNGATVERVAPSVEPTTHVRLQLRNADFATASRIAEAINKQFGGEKPVAQAENSALVDVDTPATWRPRMTEFIAAMEELHVEVDMPARIVVNERTGTIVMGKEVRILPVAILHGNLAVEIQTVLQVSQPGPLSQGKTEVVPEVTVKAKDEPTKNVVLKQGATVEELVRALTAVGSSARDIIAILQNLKAAGALDAELEVI